MYILYYLILEPSLLDWRSYHFLSLPLPTFNVVLHGVQQNVGFHRAESMQEKRLEWDVVLLPGQWDGCFGGRIMLDPCRQIHAADISRQMQRVANVDGRRGIKS